MDESVLSKKHDTLICLKDHCEICGGSRITPSIFNPYEALDNLLTLFMDLTKSRTPVRIAGVDDLHALRAYITGMEK